jgi:hypothetical protein
VGYKNYSKTHAKGRFLMYNDDSFFDKKLKKGLSTVITLKVVLDKVQIDIESLKKEIGNIVSKYPYIIDCYLNIYLNSSLGIEKIENNINQLMKLVKEFRFGVSLKIPIVHIFFSVSNDYEKLFEIASRYNDINGFINLVAVIKPEFMEDCEQVIMHCRELSSRDFITFKTFFIWRVLKITRYYYSLQEKSSV